METLPCVVCGKVLSVVFDESPLQPNDGVMCTTTGNYGSSVIDQMADEPVWHFNICDSCTTTAITNDTMIQKK